MSLVLKGPCAQYSGLGKVFLGLATRLQKRFPLEVMALNNQVPPDYPLAIPPTTRNRLFGVLVGSPPDLHQFPLQYRVLYTMCEASDIPEEWKLRVREASEVWVPTSFCQRVFGQYVPCRVVPVGYENALYERERSNPQQRAAFWSRVVPEAVGQRVVGTAGVISRRKGIDLLLSVWDELALDEAVLVVKTRDTRGRIGAGRNVFVIDADWPESLMAAFYRACDLMVFPTRGEGLGLMPLESAACGTPALVTRASGAADYIDDQGVFGLAVAGLSPAEGMRVERADWYEPSRADLLQKLREWVYHPPKVRHRYRQWSMDFLIDRWETEIRAAFERCRRGSLFA